MRTRWLADKIIGLGILASVVFWGLNAVAETRHIQRKVFSLPAAVQSVESRADDVVLMDLEVMDQNGTHMQFKSEVIGDKLVVINFVYTTCTTACPIQTAIFSQLQEKLGDRLGKEVFLVSVSVDPATDIVPRLKAYADKHQTRPGWTWITGKKSEIDQVLLGLRAYSPDLDEHPSMILIGDGRVGGWTRYYGFPKIDTLMNQIHALRDQKNALSSSRPGGN
jgi:protein SCO1/2